MMNKYTILGFIFALVLLGIYQSNDGAKDIMANMETLPARSTAKTRGSPTAETLALSETESGMPVSPVSSGSKARSLLNELIITQRQLDEQAKLIKDLLSRVARLENTQGVSSQAALQPLVNTNNPSNTAKPGALAIDPQRMSDIEHIEQQTMQTFEDLVTQVSEETIDRAWAKEMESYIQQSQKQLQTDPGNPVRIVSQECRSESCVVEFTHQGAMDEEKVIGFLSEKRIRRVITHLTEHQDGNKTVAIFQR